MQVMSTSTDVDTSISSKSTRPAEVPEPPVLAAAFSRSWACCRSLWFRWRPSRRSARMASTWSRLQRHGALAADPAPPVTPQAPGEGNPWLGLEARVHPRSWSLV